MAADDARRLKAAGEDVVVFTPDYHSGDRQEEGVVRLTPIFQWGNAAILPGIVSALRGFDVIHLHATFYGSDILVALAALIWRIPLVVTFHMRPKASGWLGALFVFYRYCLEPLVFAVAKTVVVSTQDYAQANDVRHRHLQAVPFCVDVDRFSPGDGSGFRIKHGLVDDVPTMIFVGGLDAAHYFKGVDVLLRACAQLDIPWQLLVVGDGERRAALEELARSLGIADRVCFAGSVPFDELPEAYRAADVHVLPSIDRSEAFGLVTLEAMATGLPSVVSDLPGVRQVIAPGTTGLLAALGDAVSLSVVLRELLMNNERRVKMSTAARARALAEFGSGLCTERIQQIHRLYKRDHS